MDKLQKFEYQQSIESFLEDNQVYELFENLLKQLVIHRPEQPLDFLIHKLSKAERKFDGLLFNLKLPSLLGNLLTFYVAKRIFLVGPPGSNRKENALALAEYFNWQSISVGDLLSKEVSKKSEYGKAIIEAKKYYRYGKHQRFIILIVDDNIVIDLVKK